MKTKWWLLLSLLFIILGFTSCTSDGDDSQGFGVGSFSATINNQTWIATAPFAVKTGNRFTITATNLNPASTIVISINGIRPGDYGMTVFSNNIRPVVYTPDITKPRDTFLGTYGTITLSEVTENRLSGSFNVIATNVNLQVISINGVFTDIIYKIS